MGLFGRKANKEAEKSQQIVPAEQGRQTVLFVEFSVSHSSGNTTDIIWNGGSYTINPLGCWDNSGLLDGGEEVKVSSQLEQILRRMVIMAPARGGKVRIEVPDGFFNQDIENS